MKTLQRSIIIIGLIVASFVIAIIVFDPFKLETRLHTEMKIIGFNDTYNVDQTIRFQIYANGYGWTCVGTPEIIIYNTDYPSIIVFQQRNISFMCPMEPQMSSFSEYFPNQKDSYITTIHHVGNYTLHVSYRNTETEKGFKIK